MFSYKTESICHSKVQGRAMWDIDISMWNWMECVLLILLFVCSFFLCSTWRRRWNDRDQWVWENKCAEESRLSPTFCHCVLPEQCGNRHVCVCLCWSMCIREMMRYNLTCRKPEWTCFSHREEMTQPGGAPPLCLLSLLQPVCVCVFLIQRGCGCVSLQGFGLRLHVSSENERHMSLIWSFDLLYLLLNICVCSVVSFLGGLEYWRFSCTGGVSVSERVCLCESAVLCCLEGPVGVKGFL